MTFEVYFDIKKFSYLKRALVLKIFQQCEVTEGWLEPLIDPIARNPNVTTGPNMLVINYDNFRVDGIPIEAIVIFCANLEVFQK